MMSDPFLNYFALGILIFVVVVLFYGIIAIHDIPHMIAKGRGHPHQDAIHAAGWVSLFTLHVLWPFLWIWAMAYKPERGWGFSSPAASPPPPDEPNQEELERLRQRMAELESQLGSGASDGPAPPGCPAVGRWRPSTSSTTFPLTDTGRRLRRSRDRHRITSITFRCCVAYCCG